MEGREQTAVGCEQAFSEARRWIEEVTKKRFGSSNFRSALENGVLLCDLINQLKPGIIKRLNRLSTPIAGLDNVSVFLKACGKLGLNDAQLFHPGDLQDVSTRVAVRHQETSRRLKNVLITVYWLGRKAHADPSYSGPQLHFKAFESLLGVALSKALEEASGSKSSVRDSGFAETWYPDREVPSYRREDSVESLDSVESHTLSAASDCTLKAGSEGFGSDAEAELCFRMAETSSAPSKERRNIPAALRRKVGRGRVGPLLSAPSLPGIADGYKAPAPEDEFLLRACDEDSSESDGGFADPIQDDLYARRVLQAAHQTSANADTDKFLPKCWTPEEDAHVGRIKLGSRRRPWYKKMQGFSRKTSGSSEEDSEFDVTPWSKSMGDLKMEPGAQEAESITSLYLLKTGRGKAATVSLRQYQGRLRESEAKWQEDLNRWKTRRWSVTSDLHKKKKEEEQEQLEPMGGGNDDAGEQREKRRSLPKEEPKVSCASTSEASSSSLLTSNGGSGGSMPGARISTQPPPAHRGCSGAGGLIRATPHTPAVPSAASDGVQSVSSASVPDSGAPVPLQRAKSLEGVFSGTAQMSAVLPRGFRRSEGTSRLSTGVTPRPFSSKTSRMSAQARFYSVDETRNSRRDLHQLPASVPHQGTDSAPGCTDETRSNEHAAVLRKKEEEEVRGKREESAPSIRSFMSASVLVSDKAASASSRDEVQHRHTRVGLNQTPGSGTDFGFLAHWDSTGARVHSVTPGGPAQLCHLQAGDEIVALAGQRVAEMSYQQWKANMDAALREGKLLMEIRRVSLNGHSDEHTTCVSSTAVLPRKSEAKAQVNGRPVNGFPFRATNTSSCDDSVSTKTKGSSASSVDSSVYLCGGSESAISDLQVPSISASSSRWSWNPEEERRRQEKWQMEQEHLLQEKYRRDQERLEETWRRAQQEAALEENCGLEVVSQPPEKQEVPSWPTGSAMPYTPPPFLRQSKSPTSVAPAQHGQEVALVHSKQVQIAAGLPPKDGCDSSSKTSQWQSESHGFSGLNASDRKKSTSTPSLDGSHKQDLRASVKKKVRPSLAEQERLQILDEMRKKTPVLTDSSWIRQRSTFSIIHKEPVDGAPLRRHESLDNIHSRRSISSLSSSKQFSGSSRILSGLGAIAPYRGYSGRCSLGPGAAIFSSISRQSSWSRPSFIAPVSDPEEASNRTQQQDSASAAGLNSGQTPSPELRCESDTDSSSVTPVTTDSESVPAFPTDLHAARRIGEEPSS